MALAGLMGGIVLTVQYFVVLPLFALAARRAERREGRGFRNVMARDPALALKTQY
jgi:hypothetical protein